MQIKTDEIVSVLKKEIDAYRSELTMDEVGTVLEVGDGIAHVYGLQKAMAGEMVQFDNGAFGLIFNLEENSVGVVIMGGFHGQNPRLFAKGQNKPFSLDEASSQSTRRSGARHNPWLEACKGGESSPGSFLNAATITDAVNLGTVALRAGKKVLFDSEKMKITNDSEADRYLYREYRQGWEL